MMSLLHRISAEEPVYRVNHTETLSPNMVLGKPVIASTPRGNQLLRDIYVMVDPQAYESGFSPSELDLDLQEIYERHHQ